MSPLRAINPYLRKYWKRLALGILFICLTNLFAVLAPVVVRQVLDDVGQSIASYGLVAGSGLAFVFRKAVLQTVFYAGLILIGLALLRGFCMFVMRQTIIVMSRHIEFDQKNELYAHLQSMDAGFYKEWSIGDVMNRVSEDVSRVRQYTGPALMYSINLVVLCTMCLWNMARVSPLLTLYVIAPLPILATAIYFVNKVINKKSEHIQAQLSGLTTTAQESYSGIRVLKSFVQESAMFRFFENQSRAYRNSAVNLALTEALYFPSMNLFIGLSLLSTVVVGGMMAVRGEITGGNIAEFVMYLNLMMFPISSIGWVASMVQRASASQKRINVLLHEEPAIANPPEWEDTMPMPGDVRFDHVSFTYPVTGIRALKDFSLHAPPGAKICILGRTGSGKSTIAQMMLRMYDPQEGKVIIGGTDVRSVSLEQLRASIAYAPQEAMLFSDSIAGNVSFGNSAGGKDMLNAAVHTSALESDLKALPQGLETMVGERGVMLSGGQKQRTILARALLKDAPILLLDETLSAVDTRTEHTILSRMKKAVEEKTVIVISHRIFSGWVFDQILVMDDGVVVEEGTHQSLMELNGRYARLYRHQMQTA